MTPGGASLARGRGVDGASLARLWRVTVTHPLLRRRVAGAKALLSPQIADNGVNFAGGASL